MAYEPTTWESGDVVTSAKLNKLENGVANAAGIPDGVHIIKFHVVEHYDEVTEESSYEVECDLTPTEVAIMIDNGESLLGILTFSAVPQCIWLNKMGSMGFTGAMIDATATPANIVEYRIYESDDVWVLNVFPEED